MKAIRSKVKLDAYFKKQQELFNDAAEKSMDKRTSDINFGALTFGEKEREILVPRWKKIEGFDKYRMSSLGTVKSKKASGKYVIKKRYKMPRYNIRNGQHLGVVMFADGNGRGNATSVNKLRAIIFNTRLNGEIYNRMQR